MKRLGTLIYTRQDNYKIYALTMCDKCSSRISVEMYIENPQGEFSDIITIPRRDVITKKGFLDFMYDMEGDFSLDAITAMEKEVMKIIEDVGSRTLTQAKATLSELHGAVCNYIRRNDEAPEDNSHLVFVRDGYGYIRTNYFENFMMINRELGYTKRVDILKRLKIMGALINDEGRPYDSLVSIGGEKIRVYKFVMDNADDAVKEKTA